MAKSAFYKVVGENGTDFTEQITRLYFERSVESDDLLSLDMQVKSIDQEELLEGKRLKFTYGILGGEISKTRTAIIQENPPTFGKNITMKIVALDEGFIMKKDKSSRIWNNVKSSDVVKEIAKHFKLESEIEETTTIHEFLPMGGKSYFSFLKYLAELEGSGKDNKGSMRFMIHNNKLYFSRRDLFKPSVKTYRYNNGNGVVLRFNPKMKDKTAEAVSTKGSGIDNETGEVFNVQADNSTSQEIGLGKVMIGYDIDGKEISRESTDAGKIEVRPDGNKNEFEQGISATKKDSTLKEMEGRLTIIGDTTIEIEDIITIENVGDRYSGNWYIEKVYDNIHRGGFGTEMNLKRNASNSGDGSDVNDKNNSLGPEKKGTGTDVKVFNYDINGNEI